MNEIDVIAQVLIRHRTLPGGVCTCGHGYQLGESISHHRATHVFAALTLHNIGVSVEDSVEGSLRAVALAEPDAG